MLRVAEGLARPPRLSHNTVIHEDERITDFAAECHLRGDHCNGLLILNVSGGPTFNKPDVTMTPPPRPASV